MANKQRRILRDNKLAQKCISSAKRETDIILKNSSVINGLEYMMVPRFQWDELVIGAKLGQGGFSDVFEVSSISLKEKNCMKDKDSDRIFDTTGDQVLDDEKSGFLKFNVNVDDCRSYIASRCRRKSKDEARYAVKHLSSDIRENQTLFRKGAIDLLVEVLFLTSINHPHIIKIRGLAVNDMDSFLDTTGKGYFIIMDRLYEILDKKILQWAAIEQKNRNSLTSRLKMKKKTSPSRNRCLSERLYVAFHIASALNYLHEHNIVYRDLKPENIGFDVRGDVKLFDFGLVKEIYPNHKKQFGGVYNLSGNTGTRRYMSPEVAKFLPYNMLTDVYSYGLLLWEMTSLKQPFKGFSPREHSERVVYGNERPKLLQSWPLDLKTLMKMCWSEQIEIRPSFTEIKMVLKDVILHLRGGDSTGLDFSSDSKSSRYEEDDSS